MSQPHATAIAEFLRSYDQDRCTLGNDEAYRRADARLTRMDAEDIDQAQSIRLAFVRHLGKQSTEHLDENAPSPCAANQSLPELALEFLQRFISTGRGQS